MSQGEKNGDIKEYPKGRENYLWCLSKEARSRQGSCHRQLFFNNREPSSDLFVVIFDPPNTALCPVNFCFYISVLRIWWLFP
jgi:hypothetical protein